MQGRPTTDGPTPRSLDARLTRWLSGLPISALFAVFLVWFSVWSVVVLVVLETVVAEGRQRETASVAGPLMPAIGTLFAFVTAFVIATEWTQHRDAERTVGDRGGRRPAIRVGEPLARVRGSRAPPRLGTYLDSVLHDEWPGLADGQPHPTTAAHLAAFERDTAPHWPRTGSRRGPRPTCSTPPTPSP